MNDTTQTPATDIVVAQPQERTVTIFEPRAFESAQRFAKAISSSTMVPTQYQGNIANTLVALDMAQRMRISPLQVMQNLNVVHGKPSWSSQFLIGMIAACGRFSALRYETIGELGTDSYGCRCWARELATNDRLEGPAVTIGMARAEGWLTRSGSKWQTMPELMLRYRAATFFARLYAADLISGMTTDDEAVDVVDGNTGQIVSGKRKGAGDDVADEITQAAARRRELERAGQQVIDIPLDGQA